VTRRKVVVVGAGAVVAAGLGGTAFAANALTGETTDTSSEAESSKGVHASITVGVDPEATNNG
jgi:hypothetical protein